MSRLIDRIRAFGWQPAKLSLLTNSSDIDDFVRKHLLDKAFPKVGLRHVHELPRFKLGGFLRFKKREIDSAIDRLSLKSASENMMKTYLDNHI
jgi:hypothetical protein